MILRNSSDNPPFILPVIANRFPTLP